MTQVMREAMPPRTYEQLAADPARGTLVRHLRAAELGGADAAAILREAIGQRDFTGRWQRRRGAAWPGDPAGRAGQPLRR